MKNLQIHMAIPIPAEGIVSVAMMQFHQWLPTGEGAGILVKHEDLALTLWFDKKCAVGWDEVTGDDWSKHSNVCVHRINADVVVTGLRAQLLDFVKTAANEDAEVNNKAVLAQEYEELGTRVLMFTLMKLNRLIEYVFAEKGQYWLLQYPTDAGRMASYLNEFCAKARVDDGVWFRWRPTKIHHLTAQLQDERRLIREENWIEAKNYICSEERMRIPLMLLADAEFMAARGQSRAALTEGVSALETAITRFAANPRGERFLKQELMDRMGLETLRAQVERLGVTKSVAFLLPLLFTETDLPSTTLKICRDAIQQRQTVLHSGQREVSEGNLRVFLRAIRDLCEILENATDSTGG